MKNFAIKSTIKINGYFGRTPSYEQKFITIEDYGMDAQSYNENVLLFTTASEAQEFIDNNNMDACFISEFIPEDENNYFEKDGTPKF